MRQKYEIINFTANMPFRCSIQKLGELRPHLHDFFEILLILSGSCKVTVEDQVYTLRAEDVIAFNNHCTHSLLGKDCVLISVQFDQILFEKMLPNPVHPTFQCNSAMQGEQPAFSSLRRCIAKLVKNNADQRTGYELRNLSLIYGLMDIFYNYFRVDASLAQTQKQHRYAERMAKINRILSERYSEPFSLSQLAEEVHLSAPYLSKFFDQQYGMNFLSYLTEIRLTHAVQDLRNTDHNIERISADNGFPNSHAFVQAFKKQYGVLPSIYRRQSRMEITQPETSFQPETHDYIAGLKKYLEQPESTQRPQEIFSEYIRIPADGNGIPLRHTWRNMMPGGSAQSLLFGEIQDLVRQMQQNVGFQYIHFHGIFSDEMRVSHRGQDGKLVFSFLYVDKLLDFLLSQRLKPVVELSFMPTLLARNSQKRFINYCTSEPASLDDWCQLVESFVLHVLERYGSERVSQWPFIPWSAPDTSEKLFGFSSEDAFFRFYQQTYRTIRSCDPGISIGAPASYYVQGNAQWYADFLNRCEASQCAPDFVCFHYYDTQPGTNSSDAQNLFGFAGQMVLTPTPDGLADFVRFANDRYRNYRRYLLEWNNTPSQQDWLNDTCFKSCYLVKGILQNYDALDSFCYWSLSDWMGEAAVPQPMFSGGIGLFTTAGIPKPAFYAMTLLRQLGDVCIGRGEGWFAAKSPQGYQVILYNYRHYSHLYSLGERFDMTFTDRYTPFTPERSMDTHLILENIPEGTYLVREIVLGRKSGSSFDQWVQMGALELEGENELQNLRSRSQPAISKYHVQAKDGKLELDAMLEMLEVRLLMIRMEK